MSNVGKLAPYLDGVPVVASSTERDARFPSPDTNQRVHNTTSGAVERWNGSAWVTEFLAPRVYDIKAYQATGDGTTDDYTVITSCFTAASAAATLSGAPVTVLVPAGFVFKTNTALALPSNVSLRLEGTLKAGASMTAVLQTSLTTRADHQTISGSGTIDGNDLASWGVQVRYAAHYTIRDINILNTRSGFVQAGDTGASSSSYEVFCRGVNGLRDTSHTVVAGSYGFWYAYASDSAATDCVAVGMETGFRVDTNNNRFVSCHAWTDQRSSGWMVTAFDDNGTANEWHACEADTPQTYGWRCRQFNTRIFGGVVYNNGLYGQDNVVVGIRFDQTSPFADVIGVDFNSATGAHRIALDIQVNGSDLSSLNVLASQFTGTIVAFTRDHLRSTNLEKIRVGPNTAGTDITQIVVYGPTLTPASVAAASATEQTFTVAGLTTADKVVVNGPAPTAGVTIGNVRVSAADTLAIQFINATAGALTPTSGTYKILAVRS